MKTGTHPIQTRLRLFLDWGITFGQPYSVPEKAQRRVAYADKTELEQSIIRRHIACVCDEEVEPPEETVKGGMTHSPVPEVNGIPQRRQMRT